MRRPNAKQTVLVHVVVSIGKTNKRPMETTHVETGTGLFKSNHCSSYQKNDNSVWDRKRIPCQIPFFSPQINCIQDLPPPPPHKPSKGKFSPHHPSLSIVYFYQQMGDAQSVCWSKYAFYMFSSFCNFFIKMR